MTNSASALRTGSSRKIRRAVMLAAAIAVTAPLVGTAPPAVAADAPKIDKDKVYGSEQDVVARMEGTDGMKDKDGNPVPGYAPVEQAESVMGYPKGIDRDKKGAIVDPVTPEDVHNRWAKPDPNEEKAKFDNKQALADAKQAVVDAKAAAQKYADDKKNHPAPLREVAKQLADSTLTDPDVRGDTKDDAIYGRGGSEIGAEHAEMHCAGKHAAAPGGRVDQNAAKANPCVFVGKLDQKDGSKFPKVDGGSGIAGGGKKTYSVETQSTEEDSTTSGWSAGGKLTTKVTSTPAGDKGGAAPEVNGEVSFTYSYSSTATHKVTTSQKDQTEVDFPSDKKGSLQGRRDGAYYIGYIITRKINDISENDQGKESLIAIPARVYVQSPQSSTSVTYFKYQE
ncbi:hypothetical protein [Streptomyces sp. C184]|uniref:hypothetical protein n=1 Tax=Streptomyces sp. C184 TaxID=3237121 RepID=UPI0034C5D26F